jgi:predicted GIY-YIG superfamily endonuclease
MRRSVNGRRRGHIVGSVYLVHFARAHHGAWHYLGFSTNIPERVKAHRGGRGAPLLAAVTKRGIPWRVVRIWRKTDGFFEQQLKRKFALKELCPSCSGPHAHKRGH